MQQTDKKPILFWALVVGIFLVVFLFWLPGFIESVRTLADSIGSRSSESAQEFEKNVTPQIDELKKTFETLMKQLPANVQPSSQNADGASNGSESEDSAPAVVAPIETPPSSITTRAFCEGRKGFHQSRSSQQYGGYDVCIFSDGSECEQTMFQSGACKEGQTQVSEDLMKTSYGKK
ncbi:hypothetical protein HY623_02490 [Candidatus Uhrbacteria bacterium]|nr:hypothetical protein [Candidatus Uhrbacteria bacterium]